jgi:hypothetical protein
MCPQFPPARKFLRIAPLLLLSLGLLNGGCSKSDSPSYTLASGKQIKIVSIAPMRFVDGENALVMNCLTDLPIDDRTALRREAGEIWSIFQTDVEKVKLSEGIIRMVHAESSGEKSKGAGFVFVKRQDGHWHCLQDEQKAARPTAAPQK